MPVTTPPAGPVEWVAITFPRPALGTGVAAPRERSMRLGLGRGRRGPGLLGTVARAAGLLTDDEFADQKARLLP